MLQWKIFVPDIKEVKEESRTLLYEDVYNLYFHLKMFRQLFLYY
jgi:hypothetical protein